MFRSHCRISIVPVRARCCAAIVLTGTALSPAQAAPPRTVTHAPTSHAGTVAAQAKSESLDAELKDAIAHAPSSAEWPNNNYARLLDLGSATVKPDGTVVARYRLTYKLFNERARDLAEVNLPYNSSYQEIQVLSARTIKRDGSVIKVRPADIRTTAQFGDYLMYDDAQGYGFSMPGIEDNCIIDYTWEETTRPLFLPGHFTTFWGFNGPEPVGVSRFTLHVPTSKPVRSRVANDASLKATETTSPDGKTLTYVWEKRNLKPVELEPAMPAFGQIAKWMEVSSLDSWQEIASWFWKLESPQAKGTPAIRATVASLIQGKTSEEEKARALYDWCANRVRYVGLEFGLSAYKPHIAGEVHDKLYGDCKDKATLLITMLDLAGIKAAPVLLHAEDRRDMQESLPTLNAFNHCIALATVNGKEVWLDATAEACAYGDIPAGDRGVDAFVIQDGRGAFRRIPPYTGEENGIDVLSKITFAPDGSAKADVSMSLRGESGQGMRARARSTTPEQRKQIAQGLAQRLSAGATVTNFTLPDGSHKDGPFVMTVAAEAPRLAHKTGNLLLIPLGFGSAEERTNPYQAEKRKWPVVEETAATTRSTTEIKLPDGYDLEDLPTSLDLDSPIQNFHRTVAKSADGRTVTIVTTVASKPGSAAPDQYSKVRAYFDEVLKTSDDQIVLKKR